MKATKINYGVLMVGILMLIVILSTAVAGEVTDLVAVIEKIENAIMQAADLFQQGEIREGHPHVFMISPDIELSFSKELFNQDLDKAFKTLDALLISSKEAPRDSAMGKRASKADGSARKLVEDHEVDKIIALRKAEGTLPGDSAQGAGQLPLDYSVYREYQQTRRERIRLQNQMAEADMASVIEERRAAAEEIQQRRQQQRQLQEQAMKWQEQLDKEASESARAAAKWQMEHSFGAYVRRFFGMVVETSIGSFTGAFLGAVGTNLANKAVRKMYPDYFDGLGGAALSDGTKETSQETGGNLGDNSEENPEGEFRDRIDGFLSGGESYLPQEIYSTHVAPYRNKGQKVPSEVYWRHVAPFTDAARDIRY